MPMLGATYFARGADDTGPLISKPHRHAAPALPPVVVNEPHGHHPFHFTSSCTPPPTATAMRQFWGALPHPPQLVYPPSVTTWQQREIRGALVEYSVPVWEVRNKRCTRPKDFEVLALHPATVGIRDRHGGESHRIDRTCRAGAAAQRGGLAGPAAVPASPIAGGLSRASQNLRLGRQSYHGPPAYFTVRLPGYYSLSHWQPNHSTKN
eukprot:754582-Hanusia_phi.AAC.15